MQICKFFMENKCRHDNCQFIHDPLLCINYWNSGRCNDENCDYYHNFINKKCNNIIKFGKCNNKKCKFIHKQNKNIKKKKNTECFIPIDKKEVDLRMIYHNAATFHNFNEKLTSRDVVLIDNLFNDFPNLDIYNKLISEIELCKKKNQIYLNYGMVMIKLMALI